MREPETERKREGSRGTEAKDRKRERERRGGRDSDAIHCGLDYVPFLPSLPSQYAPLTTSSGHTMYWRIKWLFSVRLSGLKQDENRYYDNLLR